MFWGCIIKDKKPFEIKTGANKVIHLSEACLNSNSGEEKVYLQLHKGEKEKYNLCVLQKDKWESHKLDHFLMLATEDSTPFKLAIAGGSPTTEIHVTGYVEEEEDESDVENTPSKKYVDEEKPKDKPQTPSIPTKVQQELKKTPPSQVKTGTPENLKSKHQEAELSSDNDLEMDDESGEDLVEDSDSELDNIEELLSKKKKEEKPPVKLQRLDDGNKKQTNGASKQQKSNQKPPQNLADKNVVTSGNKQPYNPKGMKPHQNNNTHQQGKNQGGQSSQQNQKPNQGGQRPNTGNKPPQNTPNKRE